MFRIQLFWKYFFITDDEYGERSVSVNLDGEEAELIFIDHPAGEMSVSYLKIGSRYSLVKTNKYNLLEVLQFIWSEMLQRI